MNALESVFNENKCINVRIDLTRDLPVTVLGKYPSLQKKERRLNLREIIYAEDFPPLADIFNEIVSGRQKALNAHCRIHIGNDYHWVYLSCSLRKDTFNRTLHLTGTMMDVSEYLETASDDMVMAEVRNKNNAQIFAVSQNEASLQEILGIDYLRKIQYAFLMTDGIYSAIFDAKGILVCTPDSVQNEHSLKKCKFSKTQEIRYKHLLLANWTIACNDDELLQKNLPLLEVLSQTVSQIANAILVLYNEMENSKKANQQLGSNIEQQILLNNIYNIILEKKDSDEALRMVIRLVGEYLKLDRIRMYSYDCETASGAIVKEWAAQQENLNDGFVFKCSEFPLLMNELSYCDTFFSNSAFEELKKLNVKSFVVSQIAENGKFTGLIFYEKLYDDRIWSSSDKKLMRNISQIISTMLIRCNMDTALKEQNEKLKKLAFTDPVLDISNRTLLDRELTAELEKSAYGAAIALKVTNMRSVNEAFGHIHSDALLKKIAKYIDGMEIKGKRLYRFSGSVLMVLLRQSDEKAAAQFAQSLISRFRRSWMIDGEEHYMEVVAGIALYPKHGVICEDLYRSSTLAMYRAAEYNKNSFAIYTKEYENDAGAAFNIEQRLRKAIFNRMEGFYIDFQPILFSEDKSVHSFEAQARWNDTELGFFETRKLIKLAENIGIDTLIDSWVIDKACEFCRSKIDLTGNEAVSVTINLTTHELRYSSIHETIKAAILKYSLSGENIVVEIPEKALIQAYGDIAPILGALKKIGIRIAIDDFGKEFTSLTSLKNSYINFIKLNSTAFSTAIESFDRLMLESIVKLAHERGIMVAVKHIDTQYQSDRIEAYNIDLIQGAFICKCSSPQLSSIPCFHAEPKAVRKTISN